MSDSSGGIEWNVNVDTGQSEPKIKKMTQQMRDMAGAARKFHHEANSGYESLERGFEHSLHHTLRHAGLGGLMIGAGAGAFAATAGVELIQKVYEKYEERLAEMRKQFDDALKEGNKQTQTAGSQVGITSAMADKIARESKGGISPDEAATMGGKIRGEYPGATPQQLAEGIKVLKEAAPTAPGEKLMGEMMDLGIPLEDFSKLNESVKNSPDILAKFLKANKRRMLGHGYNPEGYAAYAAKQFGELTPEFAERAVNRASNEDFDKAAQDLQRQHAYVTPEILQLRATHEMEENQKKDTLRFNEEYQTGNKIELINKLKKLYPDEWGKNHNLFGPNNTEEFMKAHETESFEKFYREAVDYTSWNMHGKGMWRSMEPWRNNEDIVNALEANTHASHQVKQAAEVKSNEHTLDSSHH